MSKRNCLDSLINSLVLILPFENFYTVIQHPRLVPVHKNNSSEDFGEITLTFKIRVVPKQNQKQQQNLKLVNTDLVKIDYKEYFLTEKSTKRNN
jgi:hypothetical protein